MKTGSEKCITYTDEFKRLFIAEHEKGKLPDKSLKRVVSTSKSLGWIAFTQLRSVGDLRIEE